MAVWENDETVIVDISAANISGGGTVTEGSPNQVTITITDDDPTPTVQWTAVSQTVDENVGTVTVTAQLSAVSGLTVTVPFGSGHLPADRLGAGPGAEATAGPGCPMRP